MQKSSSEGQGRIGRLVTKIRVRKAERKHIDKLIVEEVFKTMPCILLRQLSELKEGFPAGSANKD